MAGMIRPGLARKAKILPRKAKYQAKEDEVDSIHPSEEDEIGCHRRAKVTWREKRAGWNTLSLEIIEVSFKLDPFLKLNRLPEVDAQIFTFQCQVWSEREVRADKTSGLDMLDMNLQILCIFLLFPGEEISLKYFEALKDTDRETGRIQLVSIPGQIGMVSWSSCSAFWGSRSLQAFSAEPWSGAANTSLFDVQTPREPCNSKDHLLENLLFENSDGHSKLFWIP
ncbi:hypothetical protein MC885_017394 [Smutsia gigantea]|nr:hypothetical protein MC885_017394 [Smutsia gigantea]